MSDAPAKPPAKMVPNVPAISARGMRSALSGALKGLMDGTVTVETAQAVAKVAAQMNEIMRTELEAAKLHFAITGKKNELALVAIGHAAEDDAE